jgi:hypothetical protein
MGKGGLKRADMPQGAQEPLLVLCQLHEFSKKFSNRWKTKCAKEKSKFEDMAKNDKAHYYREMKNYVPPKGDKKEKKKDPNALKRQPSAFFLFFSEHRPLGIWQRNWVKCGLNSQPKINSHMR